MSILLVTAADKGASLHHFRNKHLIYERIPCILESDESSKEHRKNWARFTRLWRADPEIYEVDPLTCPKCSGKMKVISVIEDQDVIKKILKHLGLWQLKPRPPPKATGQTKIAEYSIDYSTSQLPVSKGLPALGVVYPP
jgi:hypothetical protein